MAQTQRLLGTVYTLLADNTVGAISPTDLRDAVESLRATYGSLTLDTPIETVVAADNVFYKALGTTSEDAEAYGWSQTADNRLQYSGTVDTIAMVTAVCSLDSGTNNQVFALRLAKNGTTIADSEVHLKLATGSDTQSAGVHKLIRVSPGDYVELWVANKTSAANVTIEHLALSAVSFGIAS